MSNDLLAEMQAIQSLLAETETQMKCKYYQLAAAIMRELGHPGMADDIDQMWYGLSRRTHDNRKKAEGADLAEAVIKGVHHDAELIRNVARGVRIEECLELKDRIIGNGRRRYNPVDIQIIDTRICELEKRAEGMTDDDSSTLRSE